MAAESSVHYADSGGLQIAYRVLGDGPLVAGSGLVFEDRGEQSLKGVPSRGACSHCSNLRA